MKIIYTNKNEKILVDDDDYILLNRHSWDITNFGYARTSIDTKHILMHKLICPSRNGSMVTDHINRNKLDNQKENLRVISRAENNYNHSHKSGVSKYLGVHKHSSGNHFYAVISYKNKSIHLGKGNDLEDTARLRDYATWLLHGDIGVYNFPDINYSEFEHHKKESIDEKINKLMKEGGRLER